MFIVKRNADTKRNVWQGKNIAFNVPTLGEEADLEAQPFSLTQKPIGITNVQFSTKTAFLPSVCYRLFFFQQSIN